MFECSSREYIATFYVIWLNFYLLKHLETCNRKKFIFSLLLILFNNSLTRYFDVYTYFMVKVHKFYHFSDDLLLFASACQVCIRKKRLGKLMGLQMQILYLYIYTSYGLVFMYMLGLNNLIYFYCIYIIRQGCNASMRISNGLFVFLNKRRMQI